MILNESLFESIDIVEYKSVSNINKFKKYADEILGGYGGMSDSDIKRNIEEIYIDGELKGYIGLSKYDEEDGTKLLGIGNFMIIERGKGYGTQVINDLVSKYKNEYDLIYCFVDSDNEGAISLYKKLGKVYDEDGPNDNGQYYVTFYDNGKYRLEESYVKDSMFFLSDKDMDGKTLEPRVPNNFLIKNGYEDSKSKRVCFAPSIDKALMAISQNLKGKKFFVHTPIDVDEKYIYQPSVKDVPDVKITREVWYTAPVKLKTIGQIEVIEDDGLPGHTYTYGKDNSAELYGWKWQWIDRKELDESLTEAKKPKRKRKNQTQNNPIFKSVDDLKKWVKKRQKGLSPFCYLNPNAGNVPLSNNIFNSMFSSDGSSGVGVSAGGISNGGLSAGESMGESFNPDLELKLHHTKSLNDYLTSTEQEFIRNNIDLIDSERWLELRDKADSSFYSESTKAIFKFLADGLGYDFRYFEELLDLK